MSRPPQYDDGADGRHASKVYVPQSVPPPAYDEYTDPAAAHGWQNAYDRTEELPPVPETPGVRPRGTARGARRKPRATWRSRRAAVVVGAVGAASAALIAGVSFSGSDGAADGEDRVSPTVPDTGGPAGPDEADPARSLETGHQAGTATPPPGPSTSPSPSPDRSDTAPPSQAPTTTAPAPPATPAATAPGNSDGKPGRGRGGKGPK
ncbi:hypothetical protein AB0L35_05240 [Streptomyces sp. NPDC052309]|uniref:hypothetical protein n=1 Tax=Streptomyces sp. NPDC052309 TaxID=3155421 RepID=UPI003431EBC6